MGCEDADFEHPDLECTSKEEGTFTVEVKTYGADRLIQSYYTAIKDGALVGNGSTAAIARPCDTCLEEEPPDGGNEISSNNVIITTCVFVAVMVLIAVLAARLLNTRRYDLLSNSRCGSKCDYCSLTGKDIMMQ